MDAVTVCFMGGVGIFVSFLDIIGPQVHPQGNKALLRHWIFHTDIVP